LALGGPAEAVPFPSTYETSSND